MCCPNLFSITFVPFHDILVPVSCLIIMPQSYSDYFFFLKLFITCPNNLDDGSLDLSKEEKKMSFRK